MSLHQELELKQAILNLSIKEKDKLLIRLINKDKLLIKQLHYQLLEGPADLEERIQNLKDKLALVVQNSTQDIKNVPTYAYFRGLNNLLRVCSGLANEHEKVTKDRCSDVEVRLLLLRETFKTYPRLFEVNPSPASLKLRKYVSARIKSVFGKLNKLHEDLQFDLQIYSDAILDFATQHDLLD